MNTAGTKPHSKAGKEHEALARLIERLKRQFPHLPAGHVERLVHTRHADFNDSTVREFVPILVESAVRIALQGRHESRPTPTGRHPHRRAKL